MNYEEKLLSVIESLNEALEQSTTIDAGRWQLDPIGDMIRQAKMDAQSVLRDILAKATP